jgi:hypothetical protein
MEFHYFVQSFSKKKGAGAAQVVGIKPRRFDTLVQMDSAFLVALLPARKIAKAPDSRKSRAKPAPDHVLGESKQGSEPVSPHKYELLGRSKPPCYQIT